MQFVPDLKRISVLGLGRLGTCLSQALLRAGLQMTAVASTRIATAKQLTMQIGADVQAVSSDLLGEHAEVIFVTVPDAHVTEIASSLAVDGRHAVVHTSGALSLEALGMARARGARTGVFHPLQAFPKDANPSRFAGIHIGIEADDPELERALQEIARQLGAQPFSLRGVDRASYHAAAVFASNYVVALHAAAQRAWVRAGLDAGSARAALAPLSQGAVAAIAEHDLVEALTGPLARGDRATLERHLAALASDENLLELYRALALELLQLPLALDAPTRAQLAQLLARKSP
jgi:predicted short-subunit dehydrogenase-like oxidoreductase (DUF2520 family)